MKKIFLVLLVLIVIPCGIVFVGSVFFDDLTIGNGSESIEKIYMGKNVQIEIKGLYKSMDVEEYVLGVLPGTIPPDYDEEALKTQAVLIRTNVLKEMQEKNTSDAADLSYKYLTTEERKKIFGELNYEKDERRFRRAVVQTAGKVIKQEDSLIMALYHEVSIGKTASAKEIMGEDISYLQSVDSPQDVEAKHYMNIVMYSWQELKECMKEKNGLENGAQSVAGGGENIEDSEERAANDKKSTTDDSQNTKDSEENTTGDEKNATGNEESVENGGNIAAGNEKIEIAVTESTENGFVKTLTVDGTVITGEEAMQMFKLSSTNFYVEEVDGGVRFICLGKGECLGVSLYGANYLALQGKNYEDIIRYYYKDVSVVKYK